MKSQVVALPIRDLAVFFPKGHRILQSNEIYGDLCPKMIASGGGSIIWRKTVQASREFFSEFYEDLIKYGEGVHRRVADSYSSEADGNIDLSIIYGKPYREKSIAERLKEISGSTKYELNIGKDTLREKYADSFPPQNTAVHCSLFKDVKKEIISLWKYDLIDFVLSLNQSFLIAQVGMLRINPNDLMS